MADVTEDFITGCLCPHCKQCSRSTVMKTKPEIDSLEDGCVARTRKCNKCGLRFHTQERVEERDKDLITEATKQR